MSFDEEFIDIRNSWRKKILRLKEFESPNVSEVEV